LEWVAFDNLLTVPTPKTDWYIYKYILDQKPFAFSADYDEQLNLLSMSEELENKNIV
jgi:8-oxo-dGTP diphosphatase